MNNKSEDKERADKYYDTARKEGVELIIKTSVAYDTSLISLATVLIGFIFSMIRFSNGLLSSYKTFLTLTLILLMLTVLCALISFWTDQKYGEKLIKNAEKYAKTRKDKYRETPAWIYVSTTLKILAGIFFFFSLILLLVVFLS